MMSFRFFNGKCKCRIDVKITTAQNQIRLSGWWWVWGGGYYREQFIVGAIRPRCSVWNERPSEETLSLPPNDNNTAGGNIAESRLLHLTHFTFKTHNGLGFHSTSALFLDSSAKHTDVHATAGYFRHLEVEKCKRLMSLEICTTFDLCITSE